VTDEKLRELEEATIPWASSCSTSLGALPAGRSRKAYNKLRDETVWNAVPGWQHPTSLP
jgi:hypothetical protein